MKRERPVVVLVFAILNMVFGSLSLACYVCGGVFFLIGFAAINAAMEKMPAAEKEELISVFSIFDQIKYILIAQVALAVVMAILLLVSGIGLLGMRTWARWMSVFYGVVTIIVAIIGLVINIAYLNPAMEKWQKDLEAKQAKMQGRPGPAGPQFNNAMSNNIGSVIGTFISMIYAVALLIVMFLPHVSDAFAGKITKRPYEAQGWDSDYDRPLPPPDGPSTQFRPGG